MLDQLQEMTRLKTTQIDGDMLKTVTANFRVQLQQITHQNKRT